MAVEYAHRHKSEFGIVWQFTAEDPPVLEAGFARLSALLAAAGGLSDPRDTVGSVHAVLADSPLPWLLIFDNAPDPASVRDYLPGGGVGQVLITSQNGLWSTGLGIEVPVLELDAATRFLVSRSRDPDVVVARELAAELGGLPLVLEQAGAYVDAAGISLAAYRALFKDRRAELMARGTVAGHPAGAAATIGVALSRLDGDVAAMGLLRLLACLAAEPVPVGLLLSGERVIGIADSDVAALGDLLGDQIAAGDAVAALRRYSLVSPAEGGMVVVHRLVQAVTLDMIPDELADKWRGTAAQLVEVSIPFDVSLPSAWPREQVLGPDDRSTLTARRELAIWTGEAGNPATGRDLTAALLPDLEEALGGRHPETMTARNNLAQWAGETGDVAGAQHLYAELLADIEQVLGSQHPETLLVRQQIAYWTQRAGTRNRQET